MIWPEGQLGYPILTRAVNGRMRALDAIVRMVEGTGCEIDLSSVFNDDQLQIVFKRGQQPSSNGNR